jgi:hypothetical protein
LAGAAEQGLQLALESGADGGDFRGGALLDGAAAIDY